MVDLKKLEEAARLIIEAVGDDPTREGLVETPKRFADMMAEQFAYNAVSNEDIAREFEKTFETPESDMVVVKDIDIFSHCEHHIALMYNMKVAVGYIPRGRAHRSFEDRPHRRCCLEAFSAAGTHRYGHPRYHASRDTCR